MWPRLMRARSSASASARSTRVLTPLATSGSSWRWACTTSPSAARIADDVGQVQLALVVVVGDPVERRPQRGRCGRRSSRRSPRAARAGRHRRRAARRSPPRLPRSRARSRPKSPPIVSVRSNVSSVAAAPASRCAATIASRVSASTSGWSAFMISTSPAKPDSASRPARTASPVPRALCWTAVGRPSGHERVELRLIGRDDHHRPASAPSGSHRGQRPAQQRAAAGGVQQLRQARLHARALAGGEDEAGERWVISLKGETGAPGFEPGVAGPKPAALPLGHAPSPCGQATTTSIGSGISRCGGGRRAAPTP